MLSQLSNLSSNHYALSFIFFGIAISATALFVYNLKLYLEIRKTTFGQKKLSQIQYSESFAAQRNTRLTQAIRRTSSYLRELEALDDQSLPIGWERGITPEGYLYYIDHNTQTTSWEPPSPTSRKQKVKKKQKEERKRKR